ncbi:5-formyltetrahydrofolate cyclo-ligase [Frankliniella fusca]|uniref:5-formyltetrahydrofolate cyclo-ligase n=1 Tax=Frankliniella fusca TaxID=407009 RepID=A0AAE1H3P8_9NEOP|nr:5-formyltetrahydrofolate cyclo-ligase [Frankliniella fusca]
MPEPPAQSEAMRAAKQAVRKAVEARLQAMTPESRAAQSSRVLAKLVAHPAYARARSVAVYLSTPAEVDTVPVLEALLGAGRACFVPRYAYGAAKRAREARGLPAMEMVQLRDMDDFRALPATPWGIPQPDMDEPRPQPGQQGLPPLDLVLCPGVAFTPAGDRLGHGMGFYDKYLSALPGPKPTTIALAFLEQMVDQLPTTELDVNIDHVITGE